MELLHAGRDGDRALADVGVINQSSDKIYQYLNFDQIEEYVENAKEATA